MNIFALKQSLQQRAAVNPPFTGFIGGAECINRHYAFVLKEFDGMPAHRYDPATQIRFLSAIEHQNSRRLSNGADAWIIADYLIQSDTIYINNDGVVWSDDQEFIPAIALSEFIGNYVAGKYNF